VQKSVSLAEKHFVCAHPRMTDTNGDPEAFCTQCMWKWLCAVARAVWHGKHERNTPLRTHLQPCLMSASSLDASFPRRIVLSVTSYFWWTGASSAFSQRVLALPAWYVNSSLAQCRVLGFPDASLLYSHIVRILRCVISLACIVP